jgi:uncharacterized membrane protein YeaQ/YmgE (transglycosylase-associated protein family)
MPPVFKPVEIQRRPRLGVHRLFFVSGGLECGIVPRGASIPSSQSSQISKFNQSREPGPALPTAVGRRKWFRDPAIGDDNDEAAERSRSSLVPRMATPQITLILQQAAHEVLLWVGFGTLVGLAAKAIMPGRDPGGALGTTLMGIVGSVLGCGVVAFFWQGQRIMPISTAGFAAGTGGAFIILLFYRLLAGTFFVEAEDGERIMYRSQRARRRRLLRNG